MTNNRVDEIAEETNAAAITIEPLTEIQKIEPIKYNNEYTLSHLRNRSKEIFFVHPKDTVVVHREFRNGEHVPYSDSLVVNLTRQKMIKSIKERNLSK